MNKLDHSKDGANIAKAFNEFGISTKQKVDAKGRVLPTRETLGKDMDGFLLPLHASQDCDLTHSEGRLPCDCDVSDIAKEITGYVMDKLNKQYYDALHFGISLGRQEAIAVMDTVIPEKDTREHAAEGADEFIQIGWNMAVEEMDRRKSQAVAALKEEHTDGNR